MRLLRKEARNCYSKCSPIRGFGFSLEHLRKHCILRRWFVLPHAKKNKDEWPLKPTKEYLKHPYVLYLVSPCLNFTWLWSFRKAKQVLYMIKYVSSTLFGRSLSTCSSEGVKAIIPTSCTRTKSFYGNSHQKARTLYCTQVYSSDFLILVLVLFATEVIS
jgi:hypothetical protein